MFTRLGQLAHKLFVKWVPVPPYVTNDCQVPDGTAIGVIVSMSQTTSNLNLNNNKLLINSAKANKHMRTLREFD